MKNYYCVLVCYISEDISDVDASSYVKMHSLECSNVVILIFFVINLSFTENLINIED